jgi:hypothetical protein
MVYDLSSFILFVQCKVRRSTGGKVMLSLRLIYFGEENGEELLFSWKIFKIIECSYISWTSFEYHGEVSVRSMGFLATGNKNMTLLINQIGEFENSHSLMILRLGMVNWMLQSSEHCYFEAFILHRKVVRSRAVRLWYFRKGSREFSFYIENTITPSSCPYFSYRSMQEGTNTK